MSRNDEQSGPAPDAEAHALIMALLEDRLDEAGGRRLQELVCDDAAARRLYVRYMHQRCVLEVLSRGMGAAAGSDGESTGRPASLDDTMELPALRLAPEPAEANGNQGAEVRSQKSEVRAPAARRALAPPFIRRLHGWRLAASALLVLALGAVVWRWAAGPSLAPATLAAAPGAVWDAPYASLRTGQGVPAAPLYLKAGTAEIRLDNGVSVTIEAPARFRIDVANAADLSDGKLSAHVPAAARGFAVRTGSSRVVDLGTDFGVDVTADGKARVEVFRGGFGPSRWPTPRRRWSSRPARRHRLRPSPSSPTPPGPCRSTSRAARPSTSRTWLPAATGPRIATVLGSTRPAAGSVR